MTTKKKDESWAEFRSRIPKHTWATVPLDTISKEEFLHFLGETKMERLVGMMNTASHRDLVLQFAGQIEYGLGRILQAAVEPDAAERLFGSEGRVRDFELRIELACGLGVISETDRVELNLLRKIRNRFAHDADLHNFEHDKRVVGYIHSLKIKADSGVQIGPRNKFATIALHFISRFDTQIESELSNCRNLKTKNYSWR